MINIMYNGGRCAVIVPEANLSWNRPAHRAAKRMLVKGCQIEAIISMPAGIFKPYSGVVTSIVIFTKGGTTDQIWFYRMDADGYSLDDKRTPTPEEMTYPM